MTNLEINGQAMISRMSHLTSNIYSNLFSRLMVDDRIEIPAATDASSSSNLGKSSSETGVQTNIEALLRGELT
jgi:hypothetical protein